MKEDNSYWSTERIAYIIGLCLIGMGFLGFFAEFGVRVRLIDWENPIATFRTLQDSIYLFRLGILAWIVIVFLDLVLSISFYALLYRINKFTALMAACLRLLYAAVKGASLTGLLLANDICSASIQIDKNQLNVQANQVMQFLKLHNFGFGLGLIFFGVHLIILASILFKVRVIPNLISWSLWAAGIGYSLNTLVPILAGSLKIIHYIILLLFITPMTFAELYLAIWLLVNRKKLTNL